jgi:two-component system response regulator DesR
MAALIDDEPDLTVVAEVERGDEVAGACLRHRPDVALIDIGMPGVDGLAVVAELTRRLPTCRTVILTGLGTPEALRRALDAGAHGFFVKDMPAGQLAERVRRVHGGERVIDPDLAVAALSAADNPLTTRELDVLKVAAEGATVGEIAERLFLSGGTVRNYLSRISAKLGAKTRIEAISLARRAGWLWPDDVSDIGMIRYRKAAAVLRPSGRGRSEL